MVWLDHSANIGEGLGMTTCRICGDEVREGEDVVLIDDESVHAGCVEAPTARRVGAWAAFGSRGQMAMGDVQRDNPV
jgi:hypothetical protein